MMRDPFQLPPFAKLRGRMHEYGATYETLGGVLNLSVSAIGERFCNVTPFSLPEMYRLMDFLEIPENLMHEYFPKNGGVKPRKKAA